MIDSYKPDESEIVEWLSRGSQRVMVVGASGSGKTTLVSRLMARLAEGGQRSYCLNCDPGLPGFGVPGTLSLAYREADRWLIDTTEPLCTLDAGRFRLPLIMATRRLLHRVPEQTVLFLDTPGLVRGVGGAELIQALATSAGIDLCLLMVPEGQPTPLVNELASLPARVFTLTPPAEAQPMTRPERLQRRSERWIEHLSHGVELNLDPRQLNLLGTPPPMDMTEAWLGRQVALLHQGQLQTMGEVREASGDNLRIMVASLPGATPNELLVRDAAFRKNSLQTVRRKPTEPAPSDTRTGGASEVHIELGSLTSVSGAPQVAVRSGNVVAALVNGVMGDPLLQLRMLHQARSLLFDIGDTGRMPLRAAHQITDVFISHAHADHIGGFLWLVRCRIGHFPPCRLFGPPGLHHHIAGMVNGILWDRVEDRAPSFIVHEWYGDHLKRWEVVAGTTTPKALADTPIENGIILRDTGFFVRATELDHQVPVLAFAYEPRAHLRVRKDQLEALGLAPGPWLQQLKHDYLADHLEAPIDPGNGKRYSVSELAHDLLLESPGEKLVYATDFADTPTNINRLSTLARGAHTLFCECSFMLADREQAHRTQHLTTEACARVANLAEVKQLVAFHFSHRYEKQPEKVYQELQQYTSRVVVPKKAPF